jgi:hypothetical protein
MLNTVGEGEALDYYSFSNLVAFVNGFWEEQLHAEQSCIQVEQPGIQAVIASQVRQRVHSRTIISISLCMRRGGYSNPYSMALT